jgi:short subunit dehydrogenase-like uncharacterized protein
MKNKEWMIYGANGYTGKLITQEAINRSHKPILGGRSAERLIRLAEEMNLEYIVLDLSDNEKLYETISEFKVIFNAAGPFKYTNPPIVQACLKAETNYLDITGEVPVFEQNFKYHHQAIDKQIAIISGVGFDVIPTDCMAKYISEKILNPIELELGIAGDSGLSPGTVKTMIEYLPTGPLIRRNGQIINYNLEKRNREIKFSDKVRTVMPVTWGDLATAYRTTGIPNITIYMPYSKTMANLIGSIKFDDKNKVNRWIEENVFGPDEQTRQKAHSYIWAHVKNEKGEEAQAWLETMEGYRFTAVAGVRCIEKILEKNPKGSLTPALAFGKDFILELPETKRMDKL